MYIEIFVYSYIIYKYFNIHIYTHIYTLYTIYTFTRYRGASRLPIVYIYVYMYIVQPRRAMSSEARDYI